MYGRILRGVLATCAVSALAQAEEPRYWIELRAPASCPPLSHLQQHISDRDGRLRVEPSGAHFDIEVRQDEGGYFIANVGLPNGGSRRVKADNCDDVVPALAFIVVMDFDPELVATPPGPDATPESAADPSATPRQWRSYLGATGGLSGGRAPELLPAGGAFYELWGRGPWEMGGRASAVVGGSAFGASPGTLSLQLATTILELCPVGVSFVFVCSGLEMGVVNVRASDELSGLEQLRFSLAGRLGLQLRQEWRSWLGEVTGGILLPMTLDELVVARRNGTEQSIYTPGLSGYVGVGIGYRL